MISGTAREPIIWRDYQREAIDATFQAYDEGKRKGVIGLPTGAGKTIVAGGLFKEFLPEWQYGLFLVNRTDLIWQTQKKFLSHFYAPEQVGVIQGSTNELGRHITIASKDTLEKPKRLRQYLESIAPHKCILTIADECHTTITQSWLSLFDQVLAPEQGFLIGMSATPYRSDNQSLLIGYPDDLFYTRSLWDLIKAKHLVDIVAYEIAVDGLEEGVISVEKETQYRYQKIHKEWLDKAPGLRTLVFTRNIHDCHGFQEFYTEQGYESRIVTAKTPRVERDAIYAAFRKGEILFLINYGVLTYGNDIEEIECILMVRDLQESVSLGTYTQILGRGLRLCPWLNKERLIFLDCGRTRHTLSTFQSLFGTTKMKIPSIRQELVEREEKERVQVVEHERQTLAFPVQATGRAISLFTQEGWTVHPVTRSWTKAWTHKGKQFSLVVDYAFSGGYRALCLDANGKETVIVPQFLSSIDAKLACQQYAAEQERGGVRGPDPHILDQPVTPADIRYLRQRKVILITGLHGGSKEQQIASSDAILLKQMKKRHYYQIKAHLDQHGGAHTTTGGHIQYSTHKGVEVWGRSKKREKEEHTVSS